MTENEVENEPEFDIIESLNHIRRSKRQEYEMWNEFKTSPLKEYYFTLKIKGENLDLLSAMHPKREITSIFLQHIKYIVEHKKNIIIYICDEPGEGKSIVAIAIGLIIRKMFLTFKKDVTSELHFSFSVDQTLKILSEIPDCHIDIQDEDPKMLGEGSRSVVYSINNVLGENRDSQKCVIFCSPEYNPMSGITLVIHIMGKAEKYYKTNDPKDMISRIVIRYNSTNTKTKSNEQYLGWMRLPLRSANEIYEKEYYPLKRKNYKKLEHDLGVASPKIRVKFLRSQIEPLLKVAFEDGWSPNNKKGLNAYIDLLDESITGMERDKLVEFAFNNAQKQKKEKQKTNQTDKPIKYFESEFSVQRKDIIHEIKNTKYETWEGKIRDCEIFEMTYIDNEMNKTAAEKFNIDTSYIPKINKKVSGIFYTIIGRYWEQYCYQKLLESKKYEEVIYDGGIGKPDIICKSKGVRHTYSCKWTHFDEEIKEESTTEYQPEIDDIQNEGKEGDDNQVIVWYFNDINKEEVQFNINFKDPPKTVDIQFSLGS